MTNEKQIEYALTIEDIKAFERFYAKNHTNMPLLYALLTLLAPVAVALMALLHFLVGDTFLVRTLTIVLGCAYGLLLASEVAQRCLTRQRHRSLPQMAPHLFSSSLLRITPNSLYQRNNAGEGALQWGGLKEIAETENGIYFLLPKQGRNGQQMYLIAPRHAFASDAEMRAFADLARGYHSTAHTSAAPEPILAR